MTPEEARRMLELAAGADFVIHLDSDEAGPLLVEAGGAPLTVPELTLAAHAPGMAAMIAGMRTEYAIEHQHIPGGQWHQVTRWSHEPPLNDGHALAPDERVVCRYVTAPQPLEGEHP